MIGKEREMSKCGEFSAETKDRQGNETLLMMMEQAYYEAVHDVADFIKSGDVTIEKFESDLREVLNEQSS